MRECVAAGVRLRGSAVVAVQCSAGAVVVEATLRKCCWRGRLVLTSWCRKHDRGPGGRLREDRGTNCAGR